MTIQFTNNAATTLASGITNVATTLTVASGTGVLFPTPSGALFFYATLQSATNSAIREIVKVTARTTDTFTIVRGQDGTSGTAFSTGDKVELRVTAADLNNFGQLDTANTWASGQVFVAPVLGTPASGLLTNCTGYTYSNLTGTVPTWNQNTTGTAASLSAVLSASLGGTGVAGTLTGVLYGNGTGAQTVATTAQMLAGVGTVPIANGGTNNGSLAVTAGGVLYTDGSKVVNVGAGTSGQALLSSGAGAPVWGSAGATGTLKNIQYLTVSGTYTPTSGTTFVIVEVVGGGGGSASGGTTPAGGGAGGYARKKITSAFSGVTVTIGAGGATTSSTTTGSAGGTSSFGALVSATGGGGGVTNISGGAGGAGSSGDLNFTGGVGGLIPAAGTRYSASSPVVGVTSYNGGVANTGCGGVGTLTSGNGGSGIVIVYEYA